MKMLIEKFHVNASIAFSKANYRLRPNSSFGIWATMLLPIAIILSSCKLQSETTIFYKQNVIAAFGICLMNLAIIFLIAKRNSVKSPLWVTILTSSITTFLFWYCLRKDLFFNIISGFGVIFGYTYLLPFCIYSLPFAFTYGEAAICAQGIMLFIFSAVVNLIDIAFIKCVSPNTNSNISDTILQIGILGVCLIATLISSFKKIQNNFGFYVTSTSVVALVVIPTMHIILNRSPVLWLLMYMFDNISRIYMLLYWSACVLIAVIMIYYQVYIGMKANTALRKNFHILAVIIFFPGLIYECNLLYIATGVVFALFIMIEVIRKLNVYPFGPIFELGFVTYADEKDAAQIALTPIYLLVGCALPMWLHPNPCDLKHFAVSNILTLSSGLLSIGIGDTVASIIGSKYGKHKWKESKKTIEGTLASIFFQVLFIMFLVCLDVIRGDFHKLLQAVFAVIINALIEAKTDQVDNLVLPIITYILLL